MKGDDMQSLEGRNWSLTEVCCILELQVLMEIKVEEKTQGRAWCLLNQTEELKLY